MTILVSPTEPLAIKTLGTTASAPEKYGADILLVGKWGTCGIQRKEVKDYVNSLRGDRVARELAQMKALDIAVWIIEGKWNWTQDGVSLTVPSFTKPEFRGTVFSLNLHGYWVLHSESTADTLDSVLHLMKWLEKGEHHSMSTRPKPSNSWGRVSNRDWGIHILQSFDGISSTLAGRIYDHFAGVPIAWSVDEFGLMEIDGIGAKRASAMIGALEHGTK